MRICNRNDLNQRPSLNPNEKRLDTYFLKSDSFRKWWWILGFCVISTWLGGCRESKKSEEKTLSSKVEGNNVVLTDPSQVNFLTVESAESPRSQFLHVNGRLVWDDEVTVRIFSPLAGRVREIKAKVGQRVSQGDILSWIDSSDYGQIQTDVQRAQSDLLLFKKAVKRVQKLYRSGAAAKKDLDSAQTDYAKALSEYQRAKARLALYGGENQIVDQRYPLKSPLSGVVVEKNINPGQEVRPDQMMANFPPYISPLFVVTDPQRLWILLDIPEADLSSIKAGQEFVLHTQAYPGRAFQGTLTLVEDALDPTTRTVKVRGKIHNPSRLLKTEMYVTVAIEKKTLALSDVSTRAIFEVEGHRYVFAEKVQGRYERREVISGLEYDGRTSILKGLSPGERVVTEGCLLLEDIFESAKETAAWEN